MHKVGTVVQIPGSWMAVLILKYDRTLMARCALLMPVLSSYVQNHFFEDEYDYMDSAFIVPPFENRGVGSFWVDEVPITVHVDDLNLWDRLTEEPEMVNRVIRRVGRKQRTIPLNPRVVKFISRCRKGWERHQTNMTNHRAAALEELRSAQCCRQEQA